MTSNGLPPYVGCDLMKSILGGISSTFDRNGHQPDPNRAARFSAASASPAIQTGRCGRCTGLGANAIRSNDTYLPENLGDSLVHSSSIAPRYSSAMRPRSRNGTPRASNSSASQPTPNVAVTRPPLIQSAVASALASTTGGCNGRIATLELTRIRCVAPAMNACATVECK